jgi:SAM-dependent methyltransferase
MRDWLCSLLRCPVCAGKDWTVSVTERNYREHLGGRLTCLSCSRAFPLRNGAVDFVLDEDLSDARRLDRDMAAQSDRNILEQKRRGEFLGEARQREDEYRRASFERTDFFFRCLEYDDSASRAVLHIGCGEPFLASRFAQKGFNVIALDFILPRLDQAHEYFEREGVYFERLLALTSRIPLRDQSMDIVFSHASLHRATPHRAEDFRWFDPNNMVDTLREVRRVLKPDGFFLVGGEGEYAEELSDEQRHLEREAQRPGCYGAFYKISEYEQAFRAAGVFPNLWAQWRDDEDRLRVGTFFGGHFREIVAPGDAVNTRSDFLLSAPALKRDLDACLGTWARVRPWPGGASASRSGGWLRVCDPATFVQGWHRPETEAVGQVRWLGRETAAVVFEMDFTPGQKQLELTMRAFSALGEFDSVIFVERDGQTVAKNIHRQMAMSAAGDQELRLTANLQAGSATIRCIRDGLLRVRLYFNGDFLSALETPSDNEFHSYVVDLPGEKIRKLNQLTFEPSYALRPCDCGISNDDRWLSCQVGDIRIVEARDNWERPSDRERK